VIDAGRHYRKRGRLPGERNQGTGIRRGGQKSRTGGQHHGRTALFVGGEITEYTQLLEEARRHAIDRMVRNARLMQANAIVMMRFDSAEIGQVMSEIVAYGTAVILEPLA
jgi:uncharacterized protein YbjQ (UPF0145 family)